MRKPRIAVVGAGPSGLYTVAALLDATVDGPAQVVVLDRLPAPYGLVRYGVAPDHVKMKSVIRVLQRPFTESGVAFLGDVPIGVEGLPPEVLLRHFDAVVYSTGSPVDRRLGVPGEDLAGCYGSAEFVGWYCGHPDLAGLNPALDAPGVAVVGAGNVALDVARVLARRAADLADTDVPPQVLDTLAVSAVTDVHVLIRRAPQHVRFTPVELRQLGELDDVDVLVHDDGQLAAGVPASADKRQRTNLAILAGWAGRAPAGRRRRVHLRFLRSPRRLLPGGPGRVGAVEIERNTVDDDRVRGTGELTDLAVGLVVPAIGYDAVPIPGLPFDERTGTVPNVAGRVVGADGTPVPGTYVAGWIKRGPSGVIGTNKGDAAQTVATLLADLAATPRRELPDQADLADDLDRYGVRPVDWSGWLRIDAAEVGRGRLRGTERVKIAELADLRAVAHGRVVEPSR